MAEEKVQATWEELFKRHFDLEKERCRYIFFDGYETYADYEKYGDMFSTPETRYKEVSFVRYTPASHQLGEKNK